MLCRGAAGIGHVDMRIGAVGDQCVGMLDHLRRHIGVQIEADHQRQILADHLAHPRQNFAFAVVEMFGHHGAVQIEIDGVERPGGFDAVDHHLDDALIGILGDMRRRTGAAGDRRNQLPAIGLRRFDESGQSHIDTAHHLEHVGAQRHRRPAAAMHEIGIGRLGRRESVGFVQEAANGDTGHEGYLGE